MIEQSNVFKASQTYLPEEFTNTEPLAIVHCDNHFQAAWLAPNSSLPPIEASFWERQDGTELLAAWQQQFAARMSVWPGMGVDEEDKECEEG